MKITSHFFKLLFLVTILSLQYSCTEEQENFQEVEKATKQLKNKTVTSSDDFELKMSILQKGTIDLLKNTEIQKIVYDYVTLDDVDEQISYAKLNSLAASKGLNLVQLMESSILANGGTEEEADQLANLLDCFSINNELKCPIIHIPFTETVDLFVEDPILGLSYGEEPNDVWYGQDYFASTSGTQIVLSANVSSSRPLWHMSVRGASGSGAGLGAGGWLPWRRCYCTRGSYDPNDHTISTVGACTQFRSSENRCLNKCDRTGFNGECDGSPCAGC